METVRGAGVVRRGLRGRRSLLVSATLVLLMGLLGLYAGHSAGQTAREVHRADRSLLQSTLAGLTGQYVLLSFAEITGALEHAARAGSVQWSPTPGDPATAARLQELVRRTRVLDAGALLLGPDGAPLHAWSPGGALPEQDDPGWEPLRQALVARDGRLPLSGVLDAGGRPLIAMAVPVPLVGGTTGVVVGLYEAAAGGLQEYVAGLRYGSTGHGYVVDRAGRVVAGPAPGGDTSVLGELLPLEQVRARVVGGGEGLLDTVEGDRAYVTSYAAAGPTGWVALTAQDADEFEGALARSSRRVELVVVALLLVSGAGLVRLNRRRESALRAVARRDDLTGVLNRRGWTAVAQHELDRARRQEQARVLLFVDLDGLKQVNDVLGHREGDRAIRDAAAVLQRASRASDVVGRLGGDEFVVLFGEGGDVEAVQRRVTEALDAHNAASGAGYELRMSLGCQVWTPADPWPVDELVRHADAVMYAHKTSRPQRAEGVIRVPAPRAPAQPVRR